MEMVNAKIVFTKPAIRRLCRAAGVKRVALDVYDFVEKWLADIIDFSFYEIISSSDSKNISLDDVNIYYEEKFTDLVQLSHLNLKNRYDSFYNKISNREKIKETYLLKTTFSKYVKSLLVKNRGYKFSSESVLLFQIGCEISLIALFESAYLNSIHNNRITLKNKDLRLAFMILSKCPIVTSPRSVVCGK